jgi:hypothetical protein
MGFNGFGDLSERANDGYSCGSGTATNPRFVIQPLSRVRCNAAGQAVETGNDVAIDNATPLVTAQGSAYSGALITNQLFGQAPNGNSKALCDALDVDGQRCKTVEINSTVTDGVYDGLVRLLPFFRSVMGRCLRKSRWQGEFLHTRCSVRVCRTSTPSPKARAITHFGYAEIGKNRA